MLMLEPMASSCDSEHESSKCRRTRRNEVTGEVYNPDEHLDNDIDLYPKTEQQRNYLKDQLMTLAMLRALDSAVINTIIDAMMPLQVQKGTVVLTEGETTADKFYIVECGTLQGTITKPNGKVEVLHNYENTGHFGGVSIFHYYPSSSTVKALTNGQLWVLDRLTYRKIVVNYASQRREINKSFLDKVPSLASFSSQQKLDLADAIISLNFNDGDLIVSKGEPAEGMYFVEAGSVKCLSPENKQLSAGEYFNEYALLANKEVCRFDVQSVGCTKLAFLEHSSFHRLLGFNVP